MTMKELMNEFANSPDPDFRDVARGDWRGLFDMGATGPWGKSTFAQKLRVVDELSRRRMFSTVAQLYEERYGDTYAGKDLVAVLGMYVQRTMF